MWVSRPEAIDIAGSPPPVAVPAHRIGASLPVFRVSVTSTARQFSRSDVRRTRGVFPFCDEQADSPRTFTAIASSEGTIVIAVGRRAVGFGCPPSGKLDAGIERRAPRRGTPPSAVRFPGRAKQPFGRTLLNQSVHVRT